MGEIGFPRREFLHDLKWWEVRSIIRGYNRRHRNLWSSTRWQTYWLVKCSMADTSKITSPTDIMQFPWEKVKDNLPSQEEIDQMQAEMAAINANIQQESDEQ